MKNDKQKAGAMKHSYSEMIQTALFTLNERGGSSRQAIWKCVQAKFPESDYKQFLVRLRKIAQNSTFLVQVNANCFKLDKKLKDRAKRALAKGHTIHKIVTTKAMTHAEQAARKKLKNEIRKQKEKEARMSKREKKRERAASKKARESEKKKASKARKSAASKDKKAKSTKEKMKDRAKANKKTQGSKAANKKTDNKRKSGAMKAKANKTKNQN